MKALLITFYLSCFLLSIAHTQTNISGFIIDEQSGEKLIGATIFDDFSKQGCVTNAYGFYSLKIQNKDSAIITASYLGYEKHVFRTDTLEATTKNIKLKPGVLLKQTEIISTRIDNKNDNGNIRLSVKTLEKLPAIGGEVDLLKAIQTMPGINSGNEGTSNIFVRGGGHDQNLIVLDDVPLYYVNHLFGFMSIFNTDAINSVNIYKTEFPARYGGRLSSVIDIRMKDGNQKKWNVSGMVGLISSKIYVDGPIKKDKTTFMFSARRMLLDLITKPFTKSSLGIATGYHFYDINSKLQHKFSDKDFFSLSFYNGDDKISIKSKENSAEMLKTSLQWGNNLLSARWNHIWNNKLFSNVTLSTSRFRYNTNSEYSSNDNINIENNTARFYSGINDYMGNIIFEYFVSYKHQINFGSNFTYHNFKPGETRYSMSLNNIKSDTTLGNKNKYSSDISVYAEYLLKLKKFNIKSGFRNNYYTIEKSSFSSFDPRLSISYNFNKFCLYVSGSKMTQNVHLLSSSGLGLPYDLWLPATKIAPPASAKQTTIGINTNIYKNIPLSLQLYYKTMNNLIMYKEGASIFASSNNWEYNIETGGKGTSFGLEAMIEKNTGKFNGWISYTLSKTDRKFDNLNYGKSFPFNYDNRHIINISAIYNINENISVSASWFFKTGNAITLANGKYYYYPEFYSGYPEEIHYYNGINNFRMRSYHRLDIGANFSKKKKWGTRTWTVSIYNFYNRKNPYYYYFKEKDTGTWVNGKFIKDKGFVLMQKSLFPFLPSVSYSFSIGK